jgi:hypothetical protein
MSAASLFQASRHRRGTDATRTLEGEFELARQASEVRADMLPLSKAAPDIGPDSHKAFRHSHVETSSGLPSRMILPLQPRQFRGRVPRERRLVGSRKSSGPVAARLDRDVFAMIRTTGRAV